MFTTCVTCVILLVGSAAVSLAQPAADEGSILKSDFLQIAVSARGELQQIDNLVAREHYPIASDEFAIVSDAGTLTNRNTAPRECSYSPGLAKYVFSCGDRFDVALEYTLLPDHAYCERRLILKVGNKPLPLLKIELGRTTFSAAPLETITYNTFWNAPTANFLRFDKGGLFAGIENPFFRTESHDATVAFSFEPSLLLGPGETYESEPQFIGVYRKSNRMIRDVPPRTMAGSNEGVDRPRFRNPCGHIPLDANEIQSMRRFAADYLDLRVNKFLSFLYMFWYPIEQLPATPELEDKYKRVIDNFHSLGGDVIIFNPLARYERPTGDMAGSWNIAPEGSAAERILAHAKSEGIGYGFYMGVAAQGDVGNACGLPFVPEKAEWKKTDPLGGVAAENCMACDDFAQWWYAVQRNTIGKYNLRLWSWDPGPGNGHFCYNDKHGHIPGKGGYKGWRNATALMGRLKREFPDLCLMAFYGCKEYGLWGLKYFDQQESYWEQTILFGATLHPDLHDDRVNADGVRLQSYWNETFRFLPTVLNHALVHRIGENCYDPQLPKVWDHLGWRYSLMSAIACSGSVTACILPEDVGQVEGMREFYEKWLGWARKNFEYVKYNITFGDQIRPGGVDGHARIKDNRGFIFLCNPGPRPARTQFVLDETIGLQHKGHFTLKELYPRENRYWYDEEGGRDVFATGELVHVEVPAYEIMLLELEPSCGSPVPRSLPGTDGSLARMLDDWRTEDGMRFAFPFHPAAESLTLTTRFRADAAIQKILKAAEPKNLAEVALLVERWRNDQTLPHNFAWARPNRLWLVLPFVDADRVGGITLQCNGAQVPVVCFSPGAPGAHIIYYADLTDAVHWSEDNVLALHLAGVQENQFLGPYLDYPPATPAILATAKGQTTPPRVVYDRPVETVMRSTASDRDDLARSHGPTVLAAKMEPTWFGSNQKVMFSATVNVPREQVLGVYLSAGWLGSDQPFQYDDAAQCWTLHCDPPQRFPILDWNEAYVWAVGTDGRPGQQRAIPIKWWYGGVSYERADALARSPWPQVREDALQALTFKKVVVDHGNQGSP